MKELKIETKRGVLLDGVLFAAAHNRLLFIEHTGHTYQQKHQKVADKILQLIKDWRKE